MRVMAPKKKKKLAKKAPVKKTSSAAKGKKAAAKKKPSITRRAAPKPVAKKAKPERNATVIAPIKKHESLSARLKFHSRLVVVSLGSGA